MKLLVPILLLTLLASCKKDKPTNTTPINTPVGGYHNGVFIINEGNFNSGNASLCFYDKATSKTELNTFANANGRPLGDVFESMYYDGSNYFLVVNNSQKVEVTSTDKLKTQKTIEGLNSPRYFLRLSGSNSGKAYLTDLYSKSIQVVDMASLKVTKSIPNTGWTEQMINTGSEVYVCGVKHHKVFVINADKDEIVDSIAVGEEPQWMCKDKEGKIWVLCNAYKKTKPASLQRIDPASHKIISNFAFPNTTYSPTRLCMNYAADTLFYLESGVCKMGINEFALPSPFIKRNGHNYYGLGIDPKNGQVYCGDALDFNQSGYVFRFRQDASKIDSFKVGINPGGFLFVD